MEGAVRAGDLKRVEELIRNGADVNERCKSVAGEGSLLIVAIDEGHKDIALALLAAGADVHARDSTGWAPLRWACFMGFEEVVQALIDRGSGVNDGNSQFSRTLLMLAADWANKAVSMCLLRAGASCEGLPKEKLDGLLRHSCQERDLFVVRNLLKNGCRVSILAIEEQEQLFHLACREGDVFVAHTLLKNGCSVSILAMEELEQLFHLACRESDMFVVHTLFKNGCSVSILSTEEQQNLLRLVCRGSDVFVVAHALLKDGCNVSILTREEQEKLLQHACCEGDILVVEVLLVSACSINCANSFGYTPLMDATKNGHEEVVKKLILAGSNVGMQNASGNTALHLAASANNIQCGILLAEGGASVMTKNNLAMTPLDLAREEFQEAIKQALSFTTRKPVCIIGNAESGKSTLIAALQAESNSSLGKIANRFKRVSDHRQRTAGIETVPHFSQKYGDVLFFDFAGQDDYHGPHQMFLESLLSKPGVSMTLLLVVKMTEEEDAILHQLHRWLTPVALMATPASPPQVIIIGSFLDKVKSKGEATAKLTRCVEATKRDLKELPLEFVGTCSLNCRKPQSTGIDRICKFLQKISIPEFSAAHTCYSLAWVLSRIRMSLTAQAVQLHEFSVWVQDNKANLPQTLPPPEEVCQDLSAAGHTLYLPNKEDPPKSWLVLDLPSILHDAYGTLFSQYKAIVNEFGLLHYHHLATFFPHLDLEMVQQLLISLEFCLPVDPSTLNVELTDLTQHEETSGWLFFPALISSTHPQSTLERVAQQSAHYLCWQLRTSKKDSISARLLQTILLRLAAHFVVKQYNEDGIQQHCCNVWYNGIEWQSRKGLNITVHIINNRVIQVLSASIVSADKSFQYLKDVISDILSTVHRLSPKLAAGAYIVHPPKMSTSPESITVPNELFPVEGIRSSIRAHEEYSLSLKLSNSERSTIVAISDFFGGYTPSLEDVGMITWPQSEPNQSQLPSGPSQLEPKGNQPPASQPEPIQIQTWTHQSPSGPSQPEPSQTRLPIGPNHPEPSQPDIFSQTVYRELMLQIQ